MGNWVVLALVVLLGCGATSAGLAPHSYSFTLVNTGTGVSDGRLRMHIDALAVPGEEYFIDNVSLTCGGPEILVNGNFGSGQAPWKFYTNAPAPQPELAIVGGEAVISFGSDGTNTQLFQKDLVLPAAGVECTLTFDACSTGGPTDPGFGHNLGLKLIKHTPPFTNYGLDLSGNPPNPQVDLLSCNPPSQCGDGILDAGAGEACDGGGVHTSSCDADCTIPVCGDGVTNPAAGEECDDGGTADGDGCDASCGLEPFCGDGLVDSPNSAGQIEDCDNGGGSVANQTTTETSICDSDCTFSVCGDGTLNTTAGEVLIDICPPDPPQPCDGNLDRVVGSITAAITRTASASGESALGDVIADAQQFATAGAIVGSAVVAFMNPGGIRADLSFPSSPAGEGDGNVTCAENFTVQPFGNHLVTMTLTGIQIDTLLEQQFLGCGTQTVNRILQVSAGFAYAWNPTAPACSKVDLASITIGGMAIDPMASYRVTVNSFLAGGGDHFAVLMEGTDRLDGVGDLAAMESYFAAFSPVAPGPQDRIGVVP